MDTNDTRVNHDIKFRVHLILNTLVHIAMGLVIYIVWFNTLKNILVNGNLELHVIFSSLGYQCLMLEGILTFAVSNSWSLMMSKYLKRWIHLVMQVLGAFFVILGFILAVVQKSKGSNKHFTSAHGICGLIGFIFTCISLLNGTMSFLAPKLRDKIRPTVVKFVHTLCGCSAITMGLVTLCLGMDKTIFLRTDTVPFAIAMTVLSLVYTLLYPATSIKGYLANMRTTEL